MYATVRTLEVGFTGWILVHRGRRFPLAIQVSQCNPESQFRSATHVCPSCLKIQSHPQSLETDILLTKKEKVF